MIRGRITRRDADKGDALVDGWQGHSAASEVVGALDPKSSGATLDPIMFSEVSL